eukprot:5594118-Amphidinium_carterae.2
MENASDPDPGLAHTGCNVDAVDCCDVVLGFLVGVGCKQGSYSASRVDIDEKQPCRSIHEMPADESSAQELMIIPAPVHQRGG